ncbi:MAG TPA: FKBP-type peptidyl-prolyl cis-trans isomerase [Polyangia bacterium]|jgi:FKBP-type peptidyl-prolyl cis-trans isomerase FkpA|nr:FKBP-type peptidyl-prolyl cis-trans isomerase [Polyangia bacterium]
MKTWKSLLLVSIGVVTFASTVGCKRLGGGRAPSTEDEKTLYTLGMILGRNLGTFNLTAGELEFVKSGLTDMVLKKEHQVDLDKYGPKVDALARKRGQERVAVEKEQSKTFLDKAGRESGAVVTPSGLVFRTVTPGTGEVPKPTDRVSVQYEGRLTDGTVFDSTKKRGGVPATFPLNGVIKCWTEGVGRMKVGEKAVLTCPSTIAYGDSGRPPTIPGGATLVFDVELVSIAPPNATPPMGMSMPGGPGGPNGLNGHPMPQQLHMGGPGGPQRLTLPPPSQLHKAPGAAQ